MVKKTKKPSKPRMGRPPLPPGTRRGASMGFRPTPEIREKLEEASKANGRSMSQEVEHRLERSFIEEANLEWAYKHIIGDEALHRAIMAAALFTRTSPEDPWMPWHKDPALRKEAAHLFFVELEREAAKLNADADKVPSRKTRKRPARKRVVRKSWLSALPA